MDSLDKLCQFGLADEEKCPYENFTLLPTVIRHTHFNEVIRRLARVHKRGKSRLGSEGFLLTAQTGTGKTRLLEYYLQHFPRYVDNGCTRIPVLFVEAPQGASTASLASAILGAMEEPFAYKGTKAERTARAVKLIKSCGVELIIVDEFQHFYEGNNRNEREDVSNWLKLLLNDTRVPVVLSGLPRSIHVLRANRELRRRFHTPHYYPPFSITQDDEFDLFRAVLKELQLQLPVPSVNLYERNLARRMYFATNGVLDYVVKILTSAVTHFRANRRQVLELEDYEMAFEKAVCNTLPENLNPFSANAELRPLMKPSEPFDKWEDPVALGLINASRHIGAHHASIHIRSIEEAPRRKARVGQHMGDRHRAAPAAAN